MQVEPCISLNVTGWFSAQQNLNTRQSPGPVNFWTWNTTDTDRYSVVSTCFSANWNTLDLKTDQPRLKTQPNTLCINPRPSCLLVLSATGTSPLAFEYSLDFAGFHYHVTVSREKRDPAGRRRLLPARRTGRTWTMAVSSICQKTGRNWINVGRRESRICPRFAHVRRLSEFCVVQMSRRIERNVETSRRSD